VCIPVPRYPGASLTISENAIPKRADRSSDYGAYELPISDSGSPMVLAPDVPASADGGLRKPGVFISAAARTVVSALDLDAQEGPTTCVFAGTLRGATILTRHTVKSGDRRNDYVVVLENLNEARELSPKATLPNGSPVGKTSASPMYLEVRLVRPGVDVFAAAPERLLDDAETVPVDPRNVLPLKRR
jgi:hypothetical protein